MLACGGTSRSGKHGIRVNTEWQSDRADFPALGVEPVTNPGLHSPLSILLLRFSDTDQRIVLAGHKRCSAANRRTFSRVSPGGWTDERPSPEAYCGQVGKKGKIDPSRFFVRDGADDTPADGRDDRVVPRDFADDAGWPRAAFGHSLGVDRRCCSNNARGRSGDRSRTACRR